MQELKWLWLSFLFYYHFIYKNKTKEKLVQCIEFNSLPCIKFQIYYNGYHGDTSATFLVGDVDAAGNKLVELTRQCRDAAIAVCGPGVPFNKIGKVIQ